ncbi:MAG: peptidoglycan-binding protein, partial [Candidatus Pacebacteria bacterium]|nr:peptidoglycan-binding protein [Candidatus Paceibacterota bacterium]
TEVTRTVYVYTNTGTAYITNSTINGVYYASQIFDSATAATHNIFGETTITNSNFFNVIIASSSLINVEATSTHFENVELTQCSVVNSFVKNYRGTDCQITDSIVDPVGILNDVSGSIILFSEIYVSDVINSTSTNAYIATSTIHDSLLTNSSSSLSTLASSTITNGTVVTSSIISGSTIASSTVNNSTSTGASVINSNLSNSTIDIGSSLNNATATNSTLTNVILSGTTISSSTIENAIFFNAVVVNDQILSGEIFTGGATTTVSTTTPVSLVDIINYKPKANVTVSTNYLIATLRDISTDPNASSSLPETWTYVWNFGDSTTLTSTTTSIGTIVQSHTYSTTGTYNTSLTITDIAGNTSTKTFIISVIAQPLGGGSSFSGSGWYTQPVTPIVSTTTSTSTQLTVIKATSTNQKVSTSTEPTLEISLEKPEKYLFERTMTIGYRGKDVYALQKLLTYYGYYTYGTITSYFGPITQNAVMLFQKDHLISPLTGIVGPKTRNTLNKLQNIQPVIYSEIEKVPQNNIYKKVETFTYKELVLQKATTTPVTEIKTNNLFEKLLMFIKSTYGLLEKVAPSTK